MSNNDTKKKINYIPISGAAFGWAVSQANKSGMELKDYIGQLIEQCAIQHQSAGALFETLSPETEVYNIYNKVKERQRMRQRVAQLAVMALQEPDNQEIADIFMQACEAAGMIHTEVMKQTESAIGSAGEYEFGETKLGECVHWIEKIFDDKTECASDWIHHTGEMLGFDKNMILRAKESIKYSSSYDYKIISRKKGRGWYWIKEVKQESTESISYIESSTISDLSMV